MIYFRGFKPFRVSNWVLLHVICLLELGIGILCVAMHNFSLGYLTALVYVLPAVCTKPSQNRYTIKKCMFEIVSKCLK